MSRDFVFGAACLALAGGYYFMTAAIPDSALADAVGPQGLPRAYAVVLGALALILIARSGPWRRHGRTGDVPLAPLLPSPSSSSRSPSSPFSPSFRRAGMLAIGVLYLVVVPTLGYVVSLAALIAATTAYQGDGFNGRIALVAVSGAVFFWILFVAILGIPHPPGIWETLF